ncbi:hypothetical protein K5E45_14655, partial [Acinetobacter baumannii]|nr:hypothetical protein [Acinetobacter baumannii]
MADVAQTEDLTNPLHLNIDELTQASIEGSGVFDVMLRSVRAHLTDEFNKNRIRGADYANVYLGGLNATLAQATAYALA